jgi:molybdopterin/thiamine biosynthesis adenylyltransferase
VQLKKCMRVHHVPIAQHADAIKAIGPLLVDVGPVAAQLAGAVAAHEVLKARGKFTPLSEPWVHDLRGEGSLAQQRVLVVGAGAIGCEVLKTLAQLGVGSVCVTDPDCIDVSNLSRQLLYRARDVGQPKSAVAARVLQARRPEVQVEAHQVMLGEDTRAQAEGLWKGITAVLGCVDNVAARLWVDAQCVARGIPLIDSGTLGAKGNTQVMLPHRSEPYSASRDPEDQPIPQCTLHLHPTRAEHCIEYARHQFHTHFTLHPLFVQGDLPAGLAAEELAQAQVHRYKCVMMFC